MNFSNLSVLVGGRSTQPNCHGTRQPAQNTWPLSSHYHTLHDPQRTLRHFGAAASGPAWSAGHVARPIRESVGVAFGSLRRSGA